MECRVDISHDAAQVPLLFEVRGPQNMREIVIWMACIERGDQVRECAPARDVAQRTEGARSRKVERLSHLGTLRRRQRRSKLECSSMLRLERAFDILVQLLVRAGGLCGVQVATTGDAAVGGAEV